jgi:SAM-dependent methyltransferase
MKAEYNASIGYSALELVDPDKMRRVIEINKRLILAYRALDAEDRILVAGAGLGIEATLIGEVFGQKTVGVDLNIAPDLASVKGGGVALLRQDIMALGFADNAFTLVYSYHVLEHVADHRIALAEIYRVLRPGGLLFVGFPNRNRLVSYIEPSQKITMADRVLWNLHDYGFRVRGRFHNKRGAHAGFSDKEFRRDACELFKAVYAVRDQYMLLKYPSFGRLIQFLRTTGLGEVVFPSNYYICLKSAI